MRRGICFDRVLLAQQVPRPPSSSSSVPLETLLRQYQQVASFSSSTNEAVSALQRLHAAILGFTDTSRNHTLVAPWQLNPVFLSGVFETPLAYSTLHKQIPSLTPFSVVYRKAFPSKRQPRHWISTLRKVLDIPAVCVHLVEVYVFFWLGLFSPSKHNPLLSLDSHRRLATLWRTRRDWEKHKQLLHDFYCSTETNKFSICAVAESFAFACESLGHSISSISETWSTQYLPRLHSTCDLIRSSSSGLHEAIRLSPQQCAAFDAFNSSMAATGPRCVLPVSFWETTLAHVRSDIDAPILDPLERPALIVAFLTHPGPLDAWERELLHRNQVPEVLSLEVLSAVRFLYAFAPRSDSFRGVLPLLVAVIIDFYLTRLGPSVLRSLIVKKLAAHRAEISRLAWRWDALFSSYRVAWPVSFETQTQACVHRRIKWLELDEATQLAVRRMQYCTNCSAIHSHHNGVPPLKANSSVQLYRATTIGCDMSAFSLFSGDSFCARSGSKLALHCGETQPVCFYLRGWTYSNYRCFFMCTKCGMQSIWDSSVCFVTPRHGPLCCRCTYCIMVNGDDDDTAESLYRELLTTKKPKTRSSRGRRAAK